MKQSNSLPSRLVPCHWPLALLAGVCSLWVGAVVAQPAPDRDARVDPASQSDRAVDPPGRVGRLADVVGQVWLYSPDTGDWVGATRNRPLTTGDRLATDDGARAEVRIGSTTLRLDSGSELEVLRLDDDRVSVQLHSGSLSARLRNRESANEFEVKTGEGRFTVLRPGRYRFDRVDESSRLTVVNGQALYEGPGSALTVLSGQRAEFWVDAGNTAQYSITEPVRDAFAAWNSERDRSDDRSVSARYVSPEMTGVEDLDRHGRWEESDEYGALWFPRVVPAGWAPYSTGHWTWVRPWGWTWVDDAPWGFAPFHYGRWVYFRDAWCWSPGTYVARPVYAPALVAWVGGPRVSVSVNIGGGPSVGWFPLAPHEVYVPSYRVTPRYVQNVNITHVTRITNVTTLINNPQAANEGRDFSNRKFPHAVTVVPTSVMTQREPVGPAAAHLRDTPAAREFINEPARGRTLVTAPVEAPPPRAAEAAPVGRPMRNRERDPNEAARAFPAPEVRAPAVAAPAEPRAREPGRVGPPQRQAPAAPADAGNAGGSTAAPVAPAAPAQAAQPVPPRPRVQPNPPVAPRSDVAPLPARRAPRETPPVQAPPPERANPPSPAPAPATAAAPAAPPPATHTPPQDAPRVRQPSPPRNAPPPAAAEPSGGKGRADEEELRRRQRERVEPGQRQNN